MKSTPFSAAREARLIARQAQKGALATLRRAARDEAKGQPYVSKVGVALAADGCPLFLFSTLAAHTQDLLADPRASVLLEAPTTALNPLEGARCTLIGQMEKVPVDDVPAARTQYLAHHPRAAQYADFGDFAMWRLRIEKVHYVGGFGQAKWAKGKEYLLGGDGLKGAEGRILKTLDDDAVQTLCAGAYVGVSGGVPGRKTSARNALGWRVLAVDGDGFVAARFVKGGQKGAPLRVNFDTPAGDLRSWRARFQMALKRLSAPAKGLS
ncbi:HugZ family pyridoxamine 5'-phosphate oxidase [Magnetovibrio blakemorei]|uniref:CREG-like beta-barrel domain-containing protein n=1 Tax=Magnetovibrio blakemorei TaxID=28181 RepID=A0A1E5QBH2_9PROT|nr:pyridoxamine 5'-phosphate oxidase family protein [Magnetovibrio blakemorei]OEJ69301.1 hypothetical protein BEN30_04270 [Magnetovibrio blakemorei]